MAETLYLRSATGQACGPTDRRSLHALKGTSEETAHLKSAGETWNFLIPEVGGRIYEAGNWDAILTLKRTGGPATANCFIARFTSSCSQQEIMLNMDMLVSTSWEERTFSGAAVGRVIFPESSLLLCVVRVLSGAIDIRFNDDLTLVSRVEAPDLISVRPHEYYKRMRRRRSC